MGNSFAQEDEFNTKVELLAEVAKQLAAKRAVKPGASVSAAQEIGSDDLGIPPVASRAPGANGADVPIGVDEADAAGVVENILATLAIEPMPHVIRFFDQLPRSILQQAKEQNPNAEQDTKGFYHNGTLYVVVSNNKSLADVENTVFHELYGHLSQAKSSRSGQAHDCDASRSTCGSEPAGSTRGDTLHSRQSVALVLPAGALDLLHYWALGAWPTSGQTALRTRGTCRLGLTRLSAEAFFSIVVTTIAIGQSPRTLIQVVACPSGQNAHIFAQAPGAIEHHTVSSCPIKGSNLFADTLDIVCRGVDLPK